MIPPDPRAFRRLSLKYHPDKNKDDATAAKMFMDVNDANEVLSDPDKRAVRARTACIQAQLDSEERVTTVPLPC